jgi:cation diffusion facilitator family transporter
VKYPRGTELPSAQGQAMKRALRLEKISIAYWITAIILLYFTLGQSQAMKAAWVEDILALFPPIAFLVAARFRHREPDAKFPWGYHRSITVAYVVATVALFALGLFILIDSVEKLLRGSHPPIGMVEIFDTQVWAGWLMLGALTYGVIPSLILGRLKQPLSEQLHDKVLYADARMNRADWMTAAAAMGGVIGIGFGLWWADAVAAIVIASDIVWDGQRYMRESIADLMDERPKTHDEEQPTPLIEEVKEAVAATSWVGEGAVRLREHGHLVAGDVWVVPAAGEEVSTERVERLAAKLHDLDWRLHDLVVSPVSRIEDAPDGIGIHERER